jgi:hypothetical protein
MLDQFVVSELFSAWRPQSLEDFVIGSAKPSLWIAENKAPD